MTADELTTALLGFTLGLSTGWCWGHSTARIRHIPIGALPEDDQAALDEAWITEQAAAFQARLDQDQERP